MKHSLFKLIQYYYPNKNILPLTASSIVYNNNKSALFFGLENLSMNILQFVNKERKYLGND